jgi:hypothetical protein
MQGRLLVSDCAPLQIPGALEALHLPRRGANWVWAHRDQLQDFQNEGVIPDIVTMAKGIGNRFPLLW